MAPMMILVLNDLYTARPQDASFSPFSASSSVQNLSILWSQETNVLFIHVNVDSAVTISVPDMCCYSFGKLCLYDNISVGVMFGWPVLPSTLKVSYRVYLTALRANLVLGHNKLVFRFFACQFEISTKGRCQFETMSLQVGQQVHLCCQRLLTCACRKSI